MNRSLCRSLALVSLLLIIVSVDRSTSTAIFNDESVYTKNNDPWASSSESSVEENDFLRERRRSSRRDVWSRLFGPERIPTRSGSLQLNENGIAPRIRLVQIDRRGIPIELQKAFYAHGIVGRRRWTNFRSNSAEGRFSFLFFVSSN